jgi:hypothetical protein
MPYSRIEADNRIYQDYKIGPSGGGIGIVGVCFELKMGSGGGCQVASCGKPKDSNFVGVNVPFFGMLTDPTEGLLGILEGRQTWIYTGTLIGDAVFQDECGNALIVEGFCYFSAFVVGGGTPIATPGANDDCFSVWIFWLKDRERGDGSFCGKFNSVGEDFGFFTIFRGYCIGDWAVVVEGYDPWGLSGGGKGNTQEEEANGKDKAHNEE